MQTGNNVEQALQINATSLRNHAAKSSNDGKELGKQDFLNLLMTQMANQDPLDPMDSEGMMQQLAALGTVEQLQNLNSQTAKMMEIQQHIARSTAGSLLGKDVEVGAREIPLNNGDTIPVTYKLDGSAERVMLLVHDSTGEMIREINLESRAQGAHEFAWDGRDNDGDMMPNGNYSYNVFARTDWRRRGRCYANQVRASFNGTF
jgi:flagellar basal-body rod modification protein FlgD